MEAIRTVSYIVTVIFFACYAYQFFYLLVPFLFKKKPLYAPASHRYAVLICARNEESVIGTLLKSLHAQSYDARLIDVYVLADNCQDRTAEVARNAGAQVFERFDSMHVGKGYALRALLQAIDAAQPERPYDGFFVFDADNVLDEHYIEEMNRVFSSGYSIVTSYRNSKNYGDNWISAGYALWFLRESRYLNDARMRLGTSCAVSGTGFLFSRQALEACGGWNFFLLTEDIEFTICMNILPAALLSFLGLFSHFAVLFVCAISGRPCAPVLLSALDILKNTYLTLFFLGAVTVCSEWKRIYAPAGKKILSMFTFPLFMLTYIPISLHALLAKKITWKPIEHRRALTLDAIRSKCTRDIFPG